MARKKKEPVHVDWRIGDVVSVGGIDQLTIIAANPDPRCPVWCLEAEDGSRYRYVHPLKLVRTR